jgi:hypothetical protein
MDKVLSLQKKWISNFVDACFPKDNEEENMNLIKSELVKLQTNKANSFWNLVNYRKASQLYNSIENLMKAREGLVPKKITVQGKNGNYQKTVWIKSNKENISGILNKINEVESVHKLQEISDKIMNEEKFKNLSDSDKQKIKSAIENKIETKNDGRQLSNLNDSQKVIYDYFKKDLNESWSDIFNNGAGNGYQGITYTNDNLKHLKKNKKAFQDNLREMIDEGIFGEPNEPKFSLFGDKFDESETKQVMEYIEKNKIPKDRSVIDFIVWSNVENTAYSLYPDK